MLQMLQMLQCYFLKRNISIRILDGWMELIAIHPSLA